jgi:hypothetical protein
MALRNLVIAAVGATTLLAGQASAVTYDLVLSGHTADFQNFQQDCCGNHFNQFLLQLSGLDSTNAITLSQGDIINATGTLDAAFTVPASTAFTNYDLNLFGSALPAQNTGTGNGTFTLFYGGSMVATFGIGASTFSQIAGAGNLFPPNSGSLTFDSFTSVFEITDLATPATYDGTQLLISAADPISAVPEPATWAMMVGGFGLVGAALRGRRKTTIAFG